MNTTQAVKAALQAMGKTVCTGKGGFHVQGQGFMTLAQARKLTGIVAPTRRAKRERMLPYGDYAIVAAFAGRLNG